MLSRDENEAYLAGLGTVGMEIFEQVPKVDAVVLPAAGQYGLLAGTAAAIKHLNSQTTVIVSADSTEMLISPSVRGLFIYCRSTCILVIVNTAPSDAF